MKKIPNYNYYFLLGLPFVIGQENVFRCRKLLQTKDGLLE
jgi:hypothetical protein